MARIYRRPQAEADVLEIWEFIAEDSVDEADRWVDRLDEKFALWATQPLMGRSRDELAENLRSMPFGRYVVFFMPVSDGIDIVRVLHSSRDVDNIFTAFQETHRK
jgi:toxin ParE1/3/4